MITTVISIVVVETKNVVDVHCERNAAAVRRELEVVDLGPVMVEGDDAPSEGDGD